MVLKFGDFINEGKGKDKNALIALLFKLLQDKPEIKSGSTFPNEKGAYSMSGIKKYFIENGYTREDADDALYQVGQDKDAKAKLKHFSVKNHYYNESYPYHYMDLSSTEVAKLKAKLEEESMEQSKPKLASREALKKKQAEVTKKAPAKKAPAKAPVDKTIEKKPAKDKTIERKAPKKTATKKTK